MVVAASSPLIAAVYREPRLEPIALCTAITFVLLECRISTSPFYDERCSLAELPKYKFLALSPELRLPLLSQFAVLVIGRWCCVRLRTRAALLSERGSPAGGGLDFLSLTVK